MYPVITVLVLFFFTIAIYLLLPDVLLNRLGIGAPKSHYGPGVALSFDDGPDPDYTPRVLEVLKKYNVRATFFIVGEKAEKYSYLVKDILREGHQLGSHGQHHVSARRLSPWRTWREWNNSIAIIEKVSGNKIHLIRPPFGAINLALWLWCIIKKKIPVYWSNVGYDWFLKQTPEMISSEALKDVKRGSIILLHDSGGEEGAPENTIRALNIICPEILEKHRLAIVPLKLSR